MRHPMTKAAQTTDLGDRLRPSASAAATECGSPERKPGSRSERDARDRETQTAA